MICLFRWVCSVWYERGKHNETVYSCPKMCAVLCAMVLMTMQFLIIFDITSQTHFMGKERRQRDIWHGFWFFGDRARWGISCEWNFDVCFGGILYTWINFVNLTMLRPSVPVQKQSQQFNVLRSTNISDVVICDAHVDDIRWMMRNGKLLHDDFKMLKTFCSCFMAATHISLWITRRCGCGSFYSHSGRGPFCLSAIIKWEEREI